MSSHETDLIERLHAMAEAFEMPTQSPAEDLRRGRRRVHRNRGVVAGAAAVALAVVIGVSAAVGGQDRAGPDRPEPVDPPKVVVLDAAPVWYDAKGLHHGDVVVQTPVRIEPGTLAVVRSGALYNEQGTFDVWLHPWSGDPRIVGHNSKAGPGGDPNGDTAVWFDNDELVVYDTAKGREISRAKQTHAVKACGGEMCAEHFPASNGFLQVSASRVMWKLEGSSAREIYSFDVQTRSSSVLKAAKKHLFVDVHDQVQVLAFRSLVLRAPGQADQVYDLEPRAKLSPSGNYLLAVGSNAEGTNHAAAIIDLRSGGLWRVPDGYPWIAWSSGDIALVDIESELLACDAARQTCEHLPTERPFLLPTN